MPYNLQNIIKPKLPSKLRKALKNMKKQPKPQSMMSVYKTKSVFSVVRQAMGFDRYVLLKCIL